MRPQSSIILATAILSVGLIAQNGPAVANQEPFLVARSAGFAQLATRSFTHFAKGARGTPLSGGLSEIAAALGARVPLVGVAMDRPFYFVVSEPTDLDVARLGIEREIGRALRGAARAFVAVPIRDQAAFRDHFESRHGKAEPLPNGLLRWRPSLPPEAYESLAARLLEGDASAMDLTPPSELHLLFDSDWALMSPRADVLFDAAAMLARIHRPSNAPLAHDLLISIDVRQALLDREPRAVADFAEAASRFAPWARPIVARVDEMARVELLGSLTAAGIEFELRIQPLPDSEMADELEADRDPFAFPASGASSVAADRGENPPLVATFATRRTRADWTLAFTVTTAVLARIGDRIAGLNGDPAAVTRTRIDRLAADLTSLGIGASAQLVLARDRDLKRLPPLLLIDGWGRPFDFTAKVGTVEIRSLGADGAPGGEAAAADIIRIVR